jgi:hypothetical protein
MEKCSHCGGIRFAGDIHVHAGSGKEEMFHLSLVDNKHDLTKEKHSFSLKFCISCGMVILL